MAELLCLTSITIVYTYSSETLCSTTYDKCDHFVVKAWGLAYVEEKKFKHRRTKSCHVRNPKVEKSDHFVKVTSNRTRKNEFCTLLYKQYRWMKILASLYFLASIHMHYSKAFNFPSFDFTLVYNFWIFRINHQDNIFLSNISGITTFNVWFCHSFNEVIW